jgi:hypothetical protein
MQALAMFAIGYSMTKSDIDRQGGFLVHTLVLMVLHILMLTAAVWAALLKRAPARAAMPKEPEPVCGRCGTRFPSRYYLSRAGDHLVCSACVAAGTP